MVKPKKTKRVKHTEPTTTTKRRGRPPNKLTIDRDLVMTLVELVGVALAGVAEGAIIEIRSGREVDDRLAEAQRLAELVRRLKHVLKGGK